MQMLTHDARKDLSPIVNDFDFALADFFSDFFCFFGRIWLVNEKIFLNSLQDLTLVDFDLKKGLCCCELW
jgi:hypothetical protein